MKGILRWAKGPNPEKGWYVTYTDVTFSAPVRRTLWWPTCRPGEGLYDDGCEMHSDNTSPDGVRRWVGRCRSGLMSYAYTRGGEQARWIEEEPIPPPPHTQESTRRWEEGWHVLRRGKWKPVAIPPRDEPWRRYSLHDPGSGEVVYGLHEVGGDNAILLRCVPTEKGKAWQNMDRGDAILVSAMGLDRRDGNQETFSLRRLW